MIFDGNRKFSHPVYFAPAEGISLGIVYRRSGSKTENDGSTGPRKKFDDIFSRVDTMNVSDRQTDRHQATAKTALTHSIAR